MSTIQIEDTIKTNIRISKTMKEGFKLIAGEKDLQDKLEELVIQYNEAWEMVGAEKMILESIRNQTKRKIANLDDNKEALQKNQIITLKTDRKIYDKFKEHCEEIGIVFGEGIRRILNQAIATEKANQYQLQMSEIVKEGK